MMDITADYNPITDETVITIKVTQDYLHNCRPARNKLSHLIDMKQFFGMLEDVVCMKWGVEMPASKGD